MTCPDCSKLLAECDEAARRIADLERREARLREALIRFCKLCPSEEGLGGYAPIAAFGIAAHFARAALQP